MQETIEKDRCKTRGSEVAETHQSRNVEGEKGAAQDATGPESVSAKRREAKDRKRTRVRYLELLFRRGEEG